MRRQKIRNALLLTSLLLFPITQFYFSPYLIIIGSAQGIITGSFIVFLLMLICGIFFGRVLCGWIMPCGGLQEACFCINDKKTKGGKYNLIKYYIWIPWLLAILGAVIQYGGYKTINPFFYIKNGISISEQWTFLIYYGVIVLIVLISLIFGKRGVCHYVCWMSPFMLVGRKIRNILKLPALQLVVEPSKCVKCNMCTKNCPMSLEVHDMVQNNNIENSECILCGKCVDICKSNAIKFNFGKPLKTLDKKPNIYFNHMK